jgi:hypothetical protein
MALPQLQNETSMVTAYEAMEMQDTLEKIDGGIEVVWETLDKLVEINTKSMDILVDMLKIDMDTFEDTRSQKAFDEEAAADAAAQQDIIGKEEKKSIDQMIQSNGSLIAGVISAITGLMALKDILPEAFSEALKSLRLGAPAAPQRQENLKRLQDKAETSGVTSSEVLEMQQDKIAIEAMKAGATPGQAEAIAVEQTTVPAGEFADIAGPDGTSDYDAYKEYKESPEQKKATAQGKIGDIFAELPPLIKMETNLPEMDLNKGIATKKIDAKLGEIETISKDSGVAIPTTIQQFIDKRRQPDIEKAEENKKVLQQLEQIEQSAKPATSPIVGEQPISSDVKTGEQLYNKMDELNLGVAASDRIDRSGVSVNPSANPNIVNNIGASSGGTGAPVVIDNSTTNNNTVVQGGGSAASTGQTVSTATRSNKSPQDPVRDRSK